MDLRGNLLVAYVYYEVAGTNEKQKQKIKWRAGHQRSNRCVIMRGAGFPKVEQNNCLDLQIMEGGLPEVEQMCNHAGAGFPEVEQQNMFRFENHGGRASRGRTDMQ